MYKNSRGWHALFHSDCEGNSGGAAGGHAYSKDGKRWTFHQKNAYNNTVVLTNGTTWKLARRERPKLVVDPATGMMTHLVNGVGLPGDCDHTFTFIQPIGGPKGSTRGTDPKETVAGKGVARITKQPSPLAASLAAATASRAAAGAGGTGRPW